MGQRGQGVCCLGINSGGNADDVAQSEQRAGRGQTSTVGFLGCAAWGSCVLIHIAQAWAQPKQVQL